jgi:hypothetical protein
MKFPAGSFERTAREVAAAPLALFECGVCWQVYDPTEGDAINQIPCRHGLRRPARALVLPRLRGGQGTLPAAG